MADIFAAGPSAIHQQQHPQTIVPSVLSSRPPTPSRSSSSGSHSGGGVPSSSSTSVSAAGFDPNAFIVNPGDYPPMPPLPPGYDGTLNPAGLSGGSVPAPFAGASPAPARMTRAASAASAGKPGAVGGGAAGGFVSFDPERGSGSDVEDDDDDEEEGRAVEGRPRKRKSTRDLRSAAAAQAPKAEDGDGKGDDDKARRKISIEFIEEKSKRHITFSKRKAGIMKKAYELSTLTGTQVLLLVVSESGWVYTFTTDKFKPLVKEDENGQLSQGQKLIAACLEAKDGPPDLAAAAYTPTNAASTGNFEANSSIHGGQISLKTGQRAPRPTASNRRVSSKGRNHIPTPVLTGHPPMDPNLPCPPGSGGIPPVPQLPTPLSGNYLDPSLPSPRGPPSAGGPRSLSHPPVSPVRPTYGMQQGLPPPPAHLQQQHPHEYMDQMTQRTDMLQLHNYDQPYDLYSTVPVRLLLRSFVTFFHLTLFLLPPSRQPTSMPPHHASAHSHDPYALPPPPPHHHQPTSAPHTPHRTLHHQASHGHLSSAGNGGGEQYDPYGLPNPPPGNYTHTRDPSLSSIDPRSGSGWQTPQHGGRDGSGSVHNTPNHSHHHQQQQQHQQQQHAMYAQQVQVGGDEYGR
ncbi:hypothetical protein JCM6882_005099 [Rhodosporidiobolus microsporus]